MEVQSWWSLCWIRARLLQKLPRRILMMTYMKFRAPSATARQRSQRRGRSISRRRLQRHRLWCGGEGKHVSELRQDQAGLHSGRKSVEAGKAYAGDEYSGAVNECAFIGAKKNPVRYHGVEFPR